MENILINTGSTVLTASTTVTVETTSSSTSSSSSAEAAVKEAAGEETTQETTTEDVTTEESTTEETATDETVVDEAGTTDAAGTNEVISDVAVDTANTDAVYDAGMYTEETMNVDPGMTTVKDPLLSSWVFVIGISAAVLFVSVALGLLLAKRKIKKGIEIYED